jgi:hypothetical protein
MGIIQDGTNRFGETRPTRAFLTFTTTGGTGPASPKVYSLGIGDPPSGVNAGFGGLGAMILKRTKIPAGTAALAGADSFYNSQANTGLLTGQTFVALSPQLTLRVSFGSVSSVRLVLVMVKPDNQPPGMGLNAIRDKIFDAGFEDAVFLDGSDSVFWNLNGNQRTKQGSFKNRVTSVGLGFITPQLIHR